MSNDVTYEDYVQWKSNEITQQLKQDLAEAMVAAGANIINREEPDANKDQYLRGYITGLRTIFEWSPTKVSHE